MLSLKPIHTQYLTYGNPSLEREGYSWCSYQAGQGICPSDPLVLPYIPLFSRWNAHNVTARELSVLAKISRHNCHEFHKTTFLENRWKARKHETLWYHTKRPSFCIAYIPQHKMCCIINSHYLFPSKYIAHHIVSQPYCLFLLIDSCLLVFYWLTEYQQGATTASNISHEVL